MLQPYPLAANERLDFTFTAEELSEIGDAIASYVLTPSATLEVTNASNTDTSVDLTVNWESATAIGTLGSVHCKITSDDGRIIERSMTFFLADPTS